MQQRGIERYAPLAGVVFVVLFVVSFAIAGEPPEPKDGPAEAVAFWSDNDTESLLGAVLESLAAVALVWFAGSLRELIARAEAGTGRLAAIAFAGLVIVAAGVAVDASLRFAAAESAGEVSPEVTHAIGTLYAYSWFPITTGFALALLGSAVAALRFGVLPAWLAWLSIVIAIVLMTPAGFFGFLASALWTAGLGIFLFLRPDATRAA